MSIKTAITIDRLKSASFRVAGREGISFPFHPDTQNFPTST